MSFKPDLEVNPGRLNIFDMGGFTVMLDYGHNKAGYSAVIDMAGHFRAPVYTGVIGMPGDRRDESIIEVGRLCGRFFSRLYIKEDNDLRGRDAGEVAGLLYSGAIEAGMDKDRIAVIYQEDLALKKAIMDAVPGEMIIMFYEELTLPSPSLRNTGNPWALPVPGREAGQIRDAPVGDGMMIAERNRGKTKRAGVISALLSLRSMTNI